MKLLFQGGLVRLLCATGALFVVTFSTALAFEVPRGVSRVAELNAARNEAYEDKKPLLLLYTMAELEIGI